MAQMSFAEFAAACAQPKPPAGLSPALLALWHDARGDWPGAHGAVQDDGGTAAAWVHAYLHRKEGDAANAAYWYRRAGCAMPADSLANEWEQIARKLLVRSAPTAG